MRLYVGLLMILLLSGPVYAGCAWILLEPPEDRRTVPFKPNMRAPLKDWTVVSFGITGSVSSYFDTKKECDEFRKKMVYGNEKGCFPVEELQRLK